MMEVTSLWGELEWFPPCPRRSNPHSAKDKGGGELGELWGKAKTKGTLAFLELSLLSIGKSLKSTKSNDSMLLSVVG